MNIGVRERGEQMAEITFKLRGACTGWKWVSRTYLGTCEELLAMTRNSECEIRILRVKEVR